MRRLFNVSVGVLVGLVALGLLFPWLVQVREVANRSTCSNHLRQMEIAIQHYENDYKRLPPGTYPKTELPPGKRLGLWIVLLPYIEGGTPRFRPAKPWDDPDNLYPVYGEKLMQGESPRNPPLRDKGPWPLFNCPSNPAQQLSNEVGLAHYVGIAGIGSDAPALTSSDPRSGVFGYEDRGLSRHQIGQRDGTSSTMLIAETAHENGPWMAGGYPTVRGLVPDGLPYLGRSGQFSALHRSASGFFRNPRFVTNVLFADGSFKSLAHGTDPSVFEALATYAGGEKVPAAWDDY